jgi:hypothetical protein
MLPVVKRTFAPQVGAVLDQELHGCSHKILNLSSGHELDSHGPLVPANLHKRRVF